MKTMNETELTSFELEGEGIKLSLKKDIKVEVVGEATREISVTKQTEAEVRETVSTVAIQEQEIASEQEENTPKVEKIEEVVAPIVGTFYAAPSPDAAPYIKVGDKVEKGDTLCILEAMKLMNEIRAEVSGTVVEVVVNDGDMVEYDQPMIKISTN